MEAKEIETNEISTPETTGAQQEMPQVTIPDKLDQQQALQVLVDAARVAQSKGIFTLDDAELVNKAIKAFLRPTGPVQAQ